MSSRPGTPVSAVSPDSAWIVGAKVTKFDHGPPTPIPDMLTTITPGFAARSTGSPRPQRSSTPGEKFSITTSARAHSSRPIDRPPSVAMFSASARLLRFHWM